MKQVNKDELRYVTQGIMSEEVIKALVTGSVYRGRRFRIMMLTSILCIACGVMAAYYLHTMFNLLLGLVAFVLILVAMTISKRRAVKVATERIRKMLGPKDVEFLTGFTDDCIYCENLSRVHAPSIIPYRDFMGMFATKDYLFLNIKGGSTVTVFKQSLSKEEITELCDFLLRKVGG